MIELMLIRASRLHRRNLRLDSTPIAKASLFPFFDRDGAIEEVMIVDPESWKLLTFRPSEVQLRIPRWGAIRLDGPTRPVDDFTIDSLAPLWHYDPCWLLQDKRYHDQPAVAILRATNCAEAFVERQPADVLFNPSLTRLRKVRLPARSENYEHKGFAREMLPPREAPSATDRQIAHQGGWQLIPIWS